MLFPKVASRSGGASVQLRLPFLAPVRAPRETVAPCRTCRVACTSSDR